MCAWWFVGGHHNPLDWPELIALTLAVYAVVVTLFSKRARFIQGDLGGTFMAVLLGLPSAVINPLFGLVVAVATYVVVLRQTYSA